MSSNFIDPSISNGTCWIGRGMQADDLFIPCGNDAYGPKTCCQARDICLSSNACYDGRWGVTYLAGCTDDTYSAKVCPDKNVYQAQSWVGLVRCFVSNDTNSNAEEWAGCENNDEPTVTSPNPCSCRTSVDPVLFTDSPALTNIASLPVSISNAIAWDDGFTPSTTITAATNTKGSSLPITPSSSKPLATTVQNTSSPSAIPSQTASTQSLSKTDIVGICVGIGSGVLLLCVLPGLYLLWRQKKSKQKPPAIMDQIRPRSQIDPAFHAKSQSNARDSTLSWQKSELAADDVIPTTSLNPDHVSQSSSQHCYRPYRPSHSSVSTTGISAVSPRQDRSGLDVVHELPG